MDKKREKIRQKKLMVMKRFDKQFKTFMENNSDFLMATTDYPDS